MTDAPKADHSKREGEEPLDPNVEPEPLDGPIFDAEPLSLSDQQRAATDSIPDVVPVHHSFQAPTNFMEPIRGNWMLTEHEMAQKKIRDQRRMLKRQHREIKLLKQEVSFLKRKLHEIEESREPGHQAMDAFVQETSGPDRRSSDGDRHPSKKPRSNVRGDKGKVSFDCAVVETDSVSTDVPKKETYDTPNTYAVVSQPVVDPYGDKGSYSGSISNDSGLPHGKGRMIYQDNQRVYNGGWNNGRWHGVGQAIFANGDTYSGDYHFDQRHGRGRYAWADGRSYGGDFQADKRHGKGTFRWPDGATYVGDFVNGFRQGHGTYTFCGGCKYTGDWKDGRYNGNGCCVWTNGRCYSGEWRAGMRHGRGIETEEDGSVRHDGQWVDDEPVASVGGKKPSVSKQKGRGSAKEGVESQSFPQKSKSQGGTKVKR